jgi:hypothetical protein
MYMTSNKEIMKEYVKNNPIGTWDALDVKILMRKAREDEQKRILEILHKHTYLPEDCLCKECDMIKKEITKSEGGE